MSAAETLPLYGLMAEYEDSDTLVEAAKKARDAGYVRMDGYTPLPVHGLSEALGQRRTKLPLIVLLGGFLGACFGYGLQYYATVIAYPIDVGGRPLHSAPAFVVVTFECTILFAALFAVLGMLARSGLPRPYHPVFNVERFAFASRDRFFLCIEAADPSFDRAKTEELLRSTGAKEVFEVDP